MVRYNLTRIWIVSKFALHTCNFDLYLSHQPYRRILYKGWLFLQVANPYTPPSALVLLSANMPAPDENSSPRPTSTNHRKRDSALHAGPRKKPYVHAIVMFSPFTNISNSCLSDPLIHHGRHFGRTLHALCNIHSLLTNGILRTIELDEVSEDSLTVE